MKYALVEFKDGKRTTRYLALTKDIKGYEPSSASDVPDREYLVKWQKSFTGEDGEYDDGFYDAKILLVGATPNEIKAKAKELKIRLPASFPATEDTEVHCPMEKPLRKRRGSKKDQVVDHESNVKSRRMSETLNMVSSPTTSSPTKGKADSQSSVSEDGASKGIEEVKSGNLMVDIKTEDDELSETPTKVPQSPVKKSSSYDNLEKSEKKLKSELAGNDSSEHESSSSEDDATVLLDKLKKEHAYCETKINKLESVNAKLKESLKTYKFEMQKKRETIKTLQEEIEELRSNNFQLKRALKKCKTDRSDSREEKQHTSSPIRMSSSLSYKSSPLPLSDGPKVTPNRMKASPSSVHSSPISSPAPTLSTSAKKYEGLNSKPSSVKRDLFAEGSEGAAPLVIKRKHSSVDNSPFKIKKSSGSDTLENVTQRIFQDLKGEQLLEGDDERVYVGMGTYINRQFWEKTIRRQKDDSKFVKDCAQAVWGLEKLKCRTVERKSKTRPVIATPEKVDFIYAMLRGKLLVRELSKAEQDLIIPNAKTWLGQKMYDCGRNPKKPKD